MSGASPSAPPRGEGPLASSPNKPRRDPAERRKEIRSSIQWPFPFEPYDIQLDLMACVRDALERETTGVVACVESPTGTGKTLSLISAVVPWLLKPENGSLQAATPAATSNGGSNSASPAKANLPAWMTEHDSAKKLLGQARTKELRERRRRRFVAYEETLNASSCPTVDLLGKRKHKRARVDSTDDSDADDEESEEARERAEELRHFSGKRKLIYCSRTHSQLAQFLSELRRLYPSSTQLSAVVLGSRGQMCVNEEVRKGGVSGINDRCLDLQESGSAKCAYNDAGTTRVVADAALDTIRDVEEMAGMGRRHGGCPYYASRLALKEADVVALPYSLLLHESMRASLNLDLSGHVVVCDEAHNLANAVSEIHCHSATLPAFQAVERELKTYLLKYRARFNLDNAASLKELMSIVMKLSSFCASQANQPSRVLELNDFLIRAKLGDVNLFDVVRRARDSRLTYKLRGIAREIREQHQLEKASSRDHSSIQDPTVSHLGTVLSFLEALTTNSVDGRVFVKEATELKFLLLNPAARFKEIVDKARCVVLAGGTMHPVADVVASLFPSVSSDRVHLFSCRHVIPKENLVVMHISRSPSGRTMTLDFQSRSDPRVLDGIGETLRAVFRVAPEGMVVFFPSHRFLSEATTRWRETKLYDELMGLKQIIAEERGASSDLALKSYGGRIASQGQAALLAVIGGKLSEGINFSDGLARCVVVVGLPYPNKTDPELAAKLAYLGEANGARLYESLCWNAVNQSLGRAIRHAKDYAAIVLLDARFKGRTAKLPRWVADAYVDPDPTGQAEFGASVVAGLEKFFRFHR